MKFLKNASSQTATTRRKALITGVGLAATAGVIDSAKAQVGLAKDTAPMYPPVAPGIDPSGRKVEPYKAACVQSAAIPTFNQDGKFLPEMLERNLQNMIALVKQSTEDHGARLMCFPEFGLQIPSGPLRAEQWMPGTIVADGPELERIGRAAQDANAFVAFNGIERINAFPGRYFLSGMIVGPSGDLVLNYRKLTSLSNKTRPGDVLSEWLGHFGEESLFPVVDTEIGRLACVIAADMYVPEVMRGMVLRGGAEVIMNPTASAALPEENNFDIPIVTTMARRVRAYENLAFILLSNLGPYGNDPQPPHSRKQPSQIIDFKGNMLAGSQTGGQEIVTATIDINAQRKARTALGSGNLLAALQTPLYRQTYEADFAPVDGLEESPIQETPEHNNLLRQTIGQLVERGTLVAPGL
ncbi:MAG: nitrilase-related carbon-nitrogen hydrolase [Rhodospirillaceae bacterium]|nr:nitrilase-related carbon-nitrogen hydrolase [Rhodospirillaceae bacterium]